MKIAFIMLLFLTSSQFVFSNENLDSLKFNAETGSYILLGEMFIENDPEKGFYYYTKH